MRRTGNVLWGIVFIAIGLVIALNVTGMADINLFFHGWWTLFIIVPSAISLIREPNKTWSIIWLVVGIALLLSAQGILQFAMIGKLILPFILVCIGLSILFRDVISSKVSKRIREVNKDGLEDICATFSGNKVTIDGPFKGANLDAVFGGVEVDLRKAEIKEDIVLNCSAIFGGVEVYVPTNVNVKIKSTPIFGGVSDKTLHNAGDGVPVIYVNAFCMFGGVDLK